MKQPEASASSMSRERASTAPESMRGPTAAAQAPATRSAVEPLAVVETRAVVGTVRLSLEPVVAWTVTVVPSTR